MGTKVLDTNRNTTKHLDALKALGYGTLIRYIAINLEHEEKVIKPDEARAIAAAGLRLGLVYEVSGKPSGTAVGARDGSYARAYAMTVGAPSGAVIWYTVDYDAGPSDLPGIVAAFRAFRAAVQPDFRVGAYASGWMLAQLMKEELIEARWITDSMGFRGSRDAAKAGAYELLQALPQVIAGLDTDPDACHRAADGSDDADIGDFVPFAGGTAIRPDPVYPVLQKSDPEPVVAKPVPRPTPPAEPQPPAFQPPDRNASDT